MMPTQNKNFNDGMDYGAWVEVVRKNSEYHKENPDPCPYCSPARCPYCGQTLKPSRFESM